MVETILRIVSDKEIEEKRRKKNSLNVEWKGLNGGTRIVFLEQEELNLKEWYTCF